VIQLKNALRFGTQSRATDRYCHTGHFMLDCSQEEARMPAYIVIDTQVPDRLTQFYCDLQNVEVLQRYGDGQYTALAPNREGLMLVFQYVPEPKEGKNRAHF